MKIRRNLKFFVFTLLLVIFTVSVVTVSARRTEIEFIDNSGLTVENEYFTGMPVGTTPDEIIGRAKIGEDLLIKDRSGIVCDKEDVVGTGYTLQLVQHSVVNKSLTAVVKGDTNGDGKISSSDYQQIKKAFIGTFDLRGAYALAADTNSDERISSVDYIRVKMHFFSKIELTEPLPEIDQSDVISPTANPGLLGDSVEYANQVKNQVKSYFNQGGDRSSYYVENAEMKLVHAISNDSGKNVKSFENKNGGVYFTESMDIYFKADGNTYPLSEDVAAPINTRFGQYYNEAHIRGFDFDGVGELMDITYNVLPDSLHVSYNLTYTEDYATLTAFGFVWQVDKNTVRAVEIKDASGIHTSFEGVDRESVEYVAYDIEGAGVVAIVFANDATCTVSPEMTESAYKVTVEMSVESATKDDDKFLNYQLYNDCTHSFEGVREASYIERNPVEVYVTDGENKKGKPVYMGYDSSKGMYHIRENGSLGTFNSAYKNPNVYTYANIEIVNDGHERPVWIWVNSKSGGLECASVLDENGNLTAIPTEVCKNFQGEYEDPVYDPEDTPYGDTIFPLYAKENETKKCTAVQYLQNWGKYALKQVSSVQFVSTYYHISTGVSETTCIAPMGVQGDVGYVLPDFRGASGDMWETQPQFTHAGDTFFVCTKDNTLAKNLAEYSGSEIISSGPTYGELKYSYISNDGGYKYTLTHLEFPQRDESRNYYTLELEFLEDYSFSNARKEFELMSYRGYFAGFQSLSYKGPNGTDVTKTGNITGTVELNKGSSYFTLHSATGTNLMNYGVIIKSYDITCGGEKWNGSLLVNTDTTGSDPWTNTMSLTLNQRKMNFVKGDKVVVNMILLPYGKIGQTHYDNVKKVYEDSVVKPMAVTAATGTVVEHEYMAIVRADNNSAEFTMSGSRNANTVRVDGFTDSSKPVIQEFVEGEWVSYDNSVESFDGYAVQYADDNTYSFSFVVDMGEEGSSRTFRVVQ